LIRLNHRVLVIYYALCVLVFEERRDHPEAFARCLADFLNDDVADIERPSLNRSIGNYMPEAVKRIVSIVLDPAAATAIAMPRDRVARIGALCRKENARLTADLNLTSGKIRLSRLKRTAGTPSIAFCH
jgi:hypothetical protein